MRKGSVNFFVAQSGEIGYNREKGPMADDTIFNYVQSYTDGEISRAACWELARFKHPTHQISFHTARALAALTFERSYEVHA